MQIVRVSEEEKGIDGGKARTQYIIERQDFSLHFESVHEVLGRLDDKAQI